jgi:hypothetical protein
MMQAQILVAVFGSLFFFSGCDGFSFEISVGPLDDDLDVRIDNNERMPTRDSDGLWVRVERTYEDYANGMADDGVEVQVLGPEESLYAATLRPIACASEGPEWDVERVYVTVLHTADTRTVAVNGVDCFRGNELVSSRP